MRAVEIIAAAEQRRIFVEQPRLQRRQPFGHAIDFLQHVGLLQLVELVLAEFMLDADRPLHEKRRPRLDPHARPRRQAMAKGHRPPRQIVDLLEIAVAHLQEVEREPLEIIAVQIARSEERRVGKECVSTCRSRWSPYHYKKKDKKISKINYQQQNIVQINYQK